MKSSPLIRTTAGLAVALGLLPAAAIERSKGEGAERLSTESLPKNEEIAAEKKAAWLGVLTEPLSADLSWHLKLDSGVIVRVVDPNSPAAEAGVQERDIIIAVDGKIVQNRDQVKASIRAHQPGEETLLKIIRQGVALDKKVILGGREQFPLAHQAPLAERVPPGFKPAFPQGMEDAENLQEELMERVEEALNGQFATGGMTQRRMELNLRDLLHGMSPDAKDFNLSLESVTNGSLSFTNEEGTVEVAHKGKEKQVKVTDRQGKVLFEGPYSSKEDKEKVPEELRERIDSVTSSDGGRFPFQFNILPGEGLKKDE